MGLDAEELVAGHSPYAFQRAWNDFVRDADVLCSWGYFPLELLRRAGGTFPGLHVDLRTAAKAWTGRRWRSESHFHEARVGSFESIGRGRGGEKLGRVTALTRFLVEVGEQERQRLGGG